MPFVTTYDCFPWRVDCEEFGTSTARAVLDTESGKRVAFAVDNVGPSSCDSELDTSHASVIMDALNVREATGLTPSQLQARVAELEAAINRLKIYIVGLPDGLTRDHMLDHVAEALKP